MERWTKGCIPPFSKKDDLGITKKYKSITLTAIAAKVYNAILLHSIKPEIEKILRKNSNGFRKNWSPTSQILTICRFIGGLRAKILDTTLQFVDLPKAFDSIHRMKMELMLQYMASPKETVTAKIVLQKHKCNDSLTWWWHQFLRHCSWSF